MKTLCSLRCKH